MPRGKRIDPTIKLKAINAVIQNGRKQADVAKEFGISAGWLSTQVKRMRKGTKRRKATTNITSKPRNDWLNRMFEQVLRESIKETINEMIKER